MEKFNLIKLFAIIGEDNVSKYVKTEAIFKQALNYVMKSEKLAEALLNFNRDNQEDNEYIKGKYSILFNLVNDSVIADCYDRTDEYAETSMRLENITGIIFNKFYYKVPIELLIQRINELKPKDINYSGIFNYIIRINKIEEISEEYRKSLDKKTIVNILCERIREGYKDILDISKSFCSYKDIITIGSSENLTIGMAWIKQFKEEPPFEFYHGPNVNINGMNNERVWRKYVNNDVPFEMTKLRYYDFMIANKGRKKPENLTGMYVYISNCTNSKVVFLDDKLELMTPAKKIAEIPVSFEDIKTYLIGELDMNNTCLLDKFTHEEWTKTTGNPECLTDVIVVSDEKNVYRERTPIIKLINWFIECISCRFDVDIPFDSKNFKL
jgi:hypothetical protein